MSEIHALSAGLALDASVIGGKAHGLVALMRLGLPVPPGFVIPTAACRVFLETGGLPGGELAGAVRELEAVTGRRFGDPARPLLVSVRSGAAVSMPGMMDTLLNVSSTGDLRAAVREVFASWTAPRAVTYRELHDIPHDQGTAVVVQAMVLGDRDDHSGSGVAFSRDPSTGERRPYGDVLFRSQGDAVVSGTVPTLPLDALATREPAVWVGLMDALDRVERHFRDVCHVEFTVESGRLWLLQVRPGGLSGRAAVRVAVDLVDEGLIDRATAVRRITPGHLRAAAVPRIRAAAPPLPSPDPASQDSATWDRAGSGSAMQAFPGSDPPSTGSSRPVTEVGSAASSGLEILARGRGAGPGVATGRVAVTADGAVRMAAAGPVILVRPHTSPLDLHGLAAAAGIVTTTGGLTSHAAVVARSMGKPAVVGATGLTVRTHDVVVNGRSIPDGAAADADADADADHMATDGHSTSEGTTGNDQTATDGRSTPEGTTGNNQTATDGRTTLGITATDTDQVVMDGWSIPEGTVITIDGTGGEIVLGVAETAAGDTGPHVDRLLRWAAEESVA
ncbi:pyruvate,orthophosphate dikinase [Actinoplanes campanulatus]|uniref:Pyruvate,orthophosphate dikinase n=1 Tax=Actinoplanes campanulatus TaxID=113559 RepID=A0A7W5ARY8_9ACTN|nr:PEP/pyruvate-binding domain-containing protein [Actinoplanes campanulatus]MBB3101271.1 pyruvate,orthophosphate dikinase [Actinoplanes campanulatus]GGN50818.1 hypothetical protein GCM10010109_90380 [Actinoplanes campanulatus]GID42155.1 hypothetical protein Aca09nite_86610 [Actinoplanes campanulatus]